MEHIDAIFYINLDVRPDRKEHFLNEMSYLCTDLTKIHRITAIPDPIGAIGCSKSHILAVETFLANPEWKTCIIFEDDFTFYNQDISHNQQILGECMTQFPAWDVFLFASSKWGKSFSNTQVPHIKKVVESQTASGYAITREFAPILLENFREAIEKLTETHDEPLYALDMYWKKLQPSHNWFIPIPVLGYQYANYSNISLKDMDYGC
jgi:GR25 family glycosyltransferase involved in LPS biosynthesis